MGVPDLTCEGVFCSFGGGGRRHGGEKQKDMVAGGGCTMGGMECSMDTAASFPSTQLPQDILFGPSHL